MTTKTKKPNIVRQIVGQYFQDAAGDYWLINPQMGWLRVPRTSRALQHYISEQAAIEAAQ